VTRSVEGGTTRCDDVVYQDRRLGRRDRSGQMSRTELLQHVNVIEEGLIRRMEIRT
jgi:hypothetical protein